jgi:hypothetical protein
MASIEFENHIDSLALYPIDPVSLTVNLLAEVFAMVNLAKFLRPGTHQITIGSDS